MKHVHTCRFADLKIGDLFNPHSSRYSVRKKVSCDYSVAMPTEECSRPHYGTEVVYPLPDRRSGPEDRRVKVLDPENLQTRRNFPTHKGRRKGDAERHAARYKAAREDVLPKPLVPLTFKSVPQGTLFFTSREPVRGYRVKVSEDTSRVAFAPQPYFVQKPDDTIFVEERRKLPNKTMHRRRLSDFVERSMKLGNYIHDMFMKEVNLPFTRCDMADAMSFGTTNTDSKSGLDHAHKLKLVREALQVRYGCTSKDTLQLVRELVKTCDEQTTQIRHQGEMIAELQSKLRSAQEETKRGTGRTTRMLKRAIEAMASGQRVIVAARDKSEIDRLKNVSLDLLRSKKNIQVVTAFERKIECGNGGKIDFVQCPPPSAVEKIERDLNLMDGRAFIDHHAVDYIFDAMVRFPSHPGLTVEQLRAMYPALARQQDSL